MTIYKVSLWWRFVISIAGFLGCLFVVLFILSPEFSFKSILQLIIGVAFIAASISAWRARVVIDESGITMPTALLIPKVYKIPWNSIQRIRRYPKGASTLIAAYYGMVYGLEIEFLKDSLLKRVKLNIGTLSKREQLLNQIAQRVGSKMEEIPQEMQAKAKNSFLSFWGVYLLIIIIVLLIVFFIYSKLTAY